MKYSHFTITQVIKTECPYCEREATREFEETPEFSKTIKIKCTQCNKDFLATFMVKEL